MINRDPASYRDPSGYVFYHNREVFRTITPAGAAAFEAIRENPTVAKLVDEGRLIGFEEIERSVWPSEVPKSVAHLVRHTLLPFISYPYEWTFAALQTAALFHLDLHIELLASDMTLSDASAYNIQFVGSSPLFIDLLSIRPYQEGEYWIGHDQFLRQFVNPLLLETWCHVPFAQFYRGGLEGIESSDLAALMPLRARLRPALQLNVFLPARLGRGRSAAKPFGKSRKSRPLSKQAFIRLLTFLRHLVAGLTPKRPATVWADYSQANSYSEAAREQKHAFVASFVKAVRPNLLVDLGCNDGEYSFLAHEKGAKSVIGFEMDRAALDRAFNRARSKQLPILPLHMDIANVSPGQGWRGLERRNLRDRLNADAIIALAVTHHLVIGRNLPFSDVVNELMSVAPAGIIEFVPKGDPMVDGMLQNREDIFLDYNAESFRAAVLERGCIVAEQQLPGSGRQLIRYSTTRDGHE